jgi:altronate hydrolase
MATTTFEAVLLHTDDNIAVASCDLAAGDEVAAGSHEVRLREAIRMGHKIALLPIAEGEPVRKYGQFIGVATRRIEPGEWVHSHNLVNGHFDRDYEYATEVPPDPEPIRGRTFLGYRRADGRAATRNYIAIISSVNCSASVSKYVAQRFDKSILRDYPQVDGILPLTHKGGCGMQYNGEDHQQLARTLMGFARHANVGAFLIIGLGCETATTGYLVNNGGLVQIGEAPPKRPPVLSMQDLGGTAKTVEAAVAKIVEMLPEVNDVRRVPIPASELILGTNCGGSDGNSGITANPALGYCSDLLVAAGGTSVLAETSEIYGAEHLMTRRARSRAIGEKLIERIRWWERYAAMFGVEIDNNPSPGNKEGGLTTIYEKSLGAVAKGSICSTNLLAASIVLAVPPTSCMLNTGGRLGAPPFVPPICTSF